MTLYTVHCPCGNKFAFYPDSKGGHPVSKECQEHISVDIIKKKYKDKDIKRILLKHYVTM